MQELPHHYYASALGQPTGIILTQSEGLPTIDVDAPKEFDGPGDKWSPEELLIGAIANCFILTFRAISNISGLGWQELNCDVKGKLEKVERQIKFTDFEITATLKVSYMSSEEKALQILEKAENNCLITNSLNAHVNLMTKIIT